MFRKVDPDTFYIFPQDEPTKVHIHTFFCFSKLDIFWLDKDRVVIDIARNVWPFMLIFSKLDNCNSFIETSSKMKHSAKIGETFKY